MDNGPGGAGRTAHGSAGDAASSALVHHALRLVVGEQGGPVCRVLDVGGGSGGWAVPLAALGARVTVVDPSPDALASLARRAREAGVGERVSAVQGDVDCLDGLVPAGSADLVLAHGVLEVVEDLARAMRALTGALDADGVLSVLVAGRAAAVLHRALAGRAVEAAQVLTDPAGRAGPRDPLLRRFDVNGLTELLARAGLQVELVQGDSVVADLIPSPAVEGAPSLGAVADLERAAAADPALREIASRLHAMARLPASG